MSIGCGKKNLVGVVSYWLDLLKIQEITPTGSSSGRQINCVTGVS